MQLSKADLITEIAQRLDGFTPLLHSRAHLDSHNPHHVGACGRSMRLRLSSPSVR